MKKYLVLILMFISMNSFAGAGYITTGATVTKVSATSQNADAFWVWYSSGTDKCSGKVKFQLANAGTEGVFQRTFTLATTALVSGKRVDVYSYTDDTDCLSAVSIDLIG
ncbi:DUF5992 family protein [Microbulbifer sp. VTAC004]|uniref:DUF5992 family protein n=1 Tax=Microbulbifer TaxID=48073 RepID=UPI00035E2A08|nr:DUF5992 family protein [Microbulbifer variabilis]